MSIKFPISNVLKSQNDNRDIYTYVLNNGLRVFIISDSDADSAAVAMNVQMGYYHDTIPGIAHFLEHMLFNGTKKYPGENHFSSFISQYNGTQNAYTTGDNTCYYFSVAQDGLNLGLDIFGQFFISPLFNKNTVDRERESVNSEHIKNINNDGWRLNKLIQAASYKNHPFTNFGSGSNKTLKVDDIDKKVKVFFETFYSADIMTLVVLTKGSIEETKKKIDNIYSLIIKRNIPKHPNLKNKILKQKKIIKYVPITDNNFFVLNWEIPFFNNPYQSPMQFLHYLMRNEQSGSIYDILKKKGYIFDFSSYINAVIESKCIYSIKMTLSQLGHKRKNEIINIIMNYIDLIKNNIDNPHLEQIYNDYMKLTLHNFLFFERSNSLNSVMEICEMMNNNLSVDPRHILVVDIMQEHYTNTIKENMKKILNLLNDDVVIISGSKKYENKYEFKEFKHYGTKYIVKNHTFKRNNLITPELSLPSLNPYISIGDTIIDICMDTPQLLYNKNNIKGYWMQYNKYNTPDVCLFASIDIRDILKDILSEVEMILYMQSLITDMNNIFSLLDSALYKTTLTYVEGKIIFFVAGNYQKFKEVCQEIFDHLMNNDVFTDKTFNNAKKNLLKSDKNSVYRDPLTKLASEFNKIISKHYNTPNDRLKIKDSIKQIKKEDAINTFNKSIKKGSILFFLSGNCNNDIAKKIISLFTKLESSHHFKHENLYNSWNQNIIHKVANHNYIEKNCAVTYNIFLGSVNKNKYGDWIKEEVVSNMLHNIMHDEYFDQLRTQDMFGYIVKGSLNSVDDYEHVINYYSFTVQSPNKTTQQIISRTIKFLQDFTTKLQSLSEDDFKSLKKSFLDSLKTNFTNLITLSSHIFTNEIATGYINSINDYSEDNYKQSLISETKKIKKNDIIEYYLKYFTKPRTIIIKIDSYTPKN